MKYSFVVAILRGILIVMFLMGTQGLIPAFVKGATVAPIVLPKKTITVFDVAITMPTGDPVAAPSADNEFTYAGAAGVVTIPVEAKVTPLKIEGEVKDLVKWTVSPIPAGSVLTWSPSWPGESTAGKGKSAVATLTGYPSNNSGFGLKTIKMEVIRDGKVLLTKTTPIELFFNRDDVSTGRGAPNWYFYWLQAIGGRANTIYGGDGNYGETPGMLNWAYSTVPDKTKIVIYNGSQLAFPGHTCSPHGIIPLTGIDLFENVVIHENKHTLQIAQADPIVGTAAGTPWRYGWSWNQVSFHNHWALGADGKPGVAGVDDDSNGSVDDLMTLGPGELGGVFKLPANGPDVLLGDISDPSENWPTAFGPPPTPPAGVSGCNPIEMDAQGAQLDVDGFRSDVDWAHPGKQHLSAAYND